MKKTGSAASAKPPAAASATPKSETSDVTSQLGSLSVTTTPTRTLVNSHSLLLRHAATARVARLTLDGTDADAKVKATLTKRGQDEEEGRVEKGAKKSFVSPRGHVLLTLADGSFVVDGALRIAPVVAAPTLPPHVELSPGGRFMSTWTKGDLTLSVHDLKAKKLGEIAQLDSPVLKLVTKKQNAAPQWASDEKLATFHASEGHVHVYAHDEAANKLSEAWRVKFEDLSLYSLFDKSTKDEAWICAFRPATKARPSLVALLSNKRRDWAIPDQSACTTFRAEEASFRWSPTQAAVLVKVESAADATGQSYYGESKLFLLTAANPGGVVVLPPKEGAIHDYQWSPSGDVFVVSAGKMPPRCTMFDLKGNGVYDFGEAPRNVVSFNPFGRFMCLGGFGNMPGDMDFWDVPKKKKMGSAKAASPPVWFGWSPCGRSFLTATLAPRMNVDNGFDVYSFRGELLAKFPLKDLEPEANETSLIECRWLPNEASAPFQDMPQSPKRGFVAGAPKTVGVEKQVYRPPGSTSNSASGGLAALLGDTQAKPQSLKYKPPAMRGDASKFVPGAELIEPVKPAKPKKEKQVKAAPTPPPAAPAAEEPAPSQGSELDPKAKLLRKYNKMLREIDALVAAGKTDSAKVAKRPEIERLIAELG